MKIIIEGIWKSRKERLTNGIMHTNYDNLWIETVNKEKYQTDSEKVFKVIQLDYDMQETKLMVWKVIDHLDAYKTM